MLDSKTQETNSGIQVHQKNIVLDVSEAADESIVFELKLSELLNDGKKIEVKGSIKKDLFHDSINSHEFLSIQLEDLKKEFNYYEHSPTYLTRLSSLSELTGEFQASEEFIRKALASGGDKSFLINKLGNNLVKQGRIDKAYDCIHSLDLTSDIEANLKLAYLSVFSGKFIDAIDYVNSALKIDNLHYGTRVLAGGLSIWNREYESAIRHFRVALAERKDSAAVYVNLAASYMCMGYTNKAISVLKQGILIDPVNQNAVMFYADILNDEEKNSQAIEPLSYFIQYNSESVDAWERLGRACYYSGIFKKTIFALTKQAEITGYTSTVLNNLGLAYWRLGKREKADGIFNHAIELDDDGGCPTETAISNYCWLLIDQKKYKKILKVTEPLLPSIEAMETKTKSFELILLQYCIALEGDNDFTRAYEKAASYLEKGIDNIEIRIKLLLHVTYYLGVIDQDKEIALKYTTVLLDLVQLHKAKLDSSLVCRGLNNVMFICLEFDEIEMAERATAGLNRYYHTDPYATATLGLLHLKKNEIDKGRKLYDEAVSLASDEKMKKRMRQRMFLELGIHYRKLGEDKQAERFLKKAMMPQFGYQYINDQVSELLEE